MAGTSKLGEYLASVRTLYQSYNDQNIKLPIYSPLLGIATLFGFLCALFGSDELVVLARSVVIVLTMADSDGQTTGNKSFGQILTLEGDRGTSSFGVVFTITRFGGSHVVNFDLDLFANNFLAQEFPCFKKIGNRVECLLSVAFSSFFSLK